MSLLRHSISVVALLALAVGYGASQYAFFTAQAPQYAQAVDRPAIKLLALALLIAAIVLAFVPHKKEPQA